MLPLTLLLLIRVLLEFVWMTVLLAIVRLSSRLPVAVAFSTVQFTNSVPWRVTFISVLPYAVEFSTTLFDRVLLVMFELVTVAVSRLLALIVLRVMLE